MAQAQKQDFVFRRNGRVHLNRRGRQFSWMLAAEVCASAVVMLDTPCSEVVWRVLTTHSIRHFLLQFSSPASPCAITFQLVSTTVSPRGSYCPQYPSGNLLSYQTDFVVFLSLSRQLYQTDHNPFHAYNFQFLSNIY